MNPMNKDASTSNRNSVKFVTHDGVRWRVVRDIRIDDEPGYELARSVMIRTYGEGDQMTCRPRILRIIARVLDCQPDQHEPKRVIKDDKVTLIYNVIRKTVLLRERGLKKHYTTTLSGLLAMCTRQEALNKARDKAFKRRTRKTA